MVLTVILPGSIKRDTYSIAIAEAACLSIETAFGTGIRHKEAHDLETGYEAYFLVAQPLLKVKKKAVEIEEQHPLGRLFDIDVIAPDASPLSRETVGRKPRRCLLCDNEARTCMRAHAHPLEELRQRIEHIVHCYQTVP